MSEHDDYSESGLTRRSIEKKTLIKNALYAAEDLGCEAILVFTKSGRLARLAAAYRPNIPVFACTNVERTVAYMNVLFGIEPVLLTSWSANDEENLINGIKALVGQGKISSGGRVVAVTDIVRGGKQIPVLEILDLADLGIG